MRLPVLLLLLLFLPCAPLRAGESPTPRLPTAEPILDTTCWRLATGRIMCPAVPRASTPTTGWACAVAGAEIHCRSSDGRTWKVAVPAR